MSLSKTKSDVYIRNEIANALDAIEVPDVDEQWAKLQKELQIEEDVKERASYSSKRYRNIAWIAIMLIAVSAILFKPTYAQAFGEKFVELFNVIVGKTTKNQTEVYEYLPGPGAPVAQDLGTNIEKEVSIEEAKEMISYTLTLPNYLPEGCSLDNVLVTSLGTNLERVTIQYAIDGNLLVFEQSNSGISASRGSLFDTDDTQVKQVNISGVPGNLFTHKTGLNTLNWESRGLLFQLTGKISSEEIIKVADSIP